MSLGEIRQALKEIFASLRKKYLPLIAIGMGGSSGLVVKGGGTRILDEHFSHYFVAKLYSLIEKTKTKHKEAGVSPFKKLAIEGLPIFLIPSRIHILAK